MARPIEFLQLGYRLQNRHNLASLRALNRISGHLRWRVTARTSYKIFLIRTLSCNSSMMSELLLSFIASPRTLGIQLDFHGLHNHSLDTLDGTLKLLYYEIGHQFQTSTSYSLFDDIVRLYES
jgi:hypothetical protein